MPRRDRELARTSRHRLTALTTPRGTSVPPHPPPAFPVAGEAHDAASLPAQGWTPQPATVRATHTVPPATPRPPTPSLTPTAAASPSGPGTDRLRSTTAPERADGSTESDAAHPPTRTSAALHVVARGYAAAHGDPVTRTQVRRRRVRWEVPWRLAAAAGTVLLLVAGGVALRSASTAPGDAVALPVPAPSGVAASASPPADVVVDVVGAVAAPGVVRLVQGSRVVDAIAAAGGATADAQLSALNLARLLVDGEQIAVPLPGEPGTGAGLGGAAAQPGDGLLDLNGADAAALDGLPGIGPVLAERIVAHRQDRPFTSVDELADVAGIGPTLLERLRDLVRV